MFKFRRLPYLPLKRLLSSSVNVLERLTSRNLIRVYGSEVSEFLQGLITNDINHLNAGPGCMYAMFLNTQGRVLYDSIIYKTVEDNMLLIECDTSVSEKLEKQLKMFRVRRKIDIKILGNELNIYALFNTSNSQTDNIGEIKSIIPCQKLNESMPQSCNHLHQDLIIYKDPRIVHLGNRIIAKSDIDVPKQLSEIVQLDQNPDKTKNYRWLRFSLGVGEGIQDLPPGNCFPLECNCDYLHGVSFHKGCYIGQELTARVHHTGVIRKRLMPIRFVKTPSQLPGESIVHEKVNLGKFRGLEGDVGLGLLRFEKALKFSEIKIGDGIAVTHKPSWWPVEVSKEKLNVQKV